MGCSDHTTQPLRRHPSTSRKRKRRSVHCFDRTFRKRKRRSVHCFDRTFRKRKRRSVHCFDRTFRKRKRRSVHCFDRTFRKRKRRSVHCFDRTFRKRKRRSVHCFDRTFRKRKRRACALCQSPIPKAEARLSGARPPARDSCVNPSFRKRKRRSISHPPHDVRSTHFSVRSLSSLQAVSESRIPNAWSSLRYGIMNNHYLNLQSPISNLQCIDRKDLKDHKATDPHANPGLASNLLCALCVLCG